MSGCPRVAFRNGVELGDPVRCALAFLENDYSYSSYDSISVAVNDVLRHEDIRAANRIGARMSASEADAFLARAPAVQRALTQISAETGLEETEERIPWDALLALFKAVDDVPGVGVAKMTKVLHKKRPRLVPMLDSVVVGYLRSVDGLPPGDPRYAAYACTRSFKKDLDANLDALAFVQRELERAGFVLTLCRILDVLMWSYAGSARPRWAAAVLAGR